ncbi:MAG: DUF3034 family protein, partial [Burkholderiales bacterium]
MFTNRLKFSAVFGAVMSAATLTAASVAGAQGVSGKLLLTGGVSTVEGSGGGGLSTWALISGYGTDGQIGANVHTTGVKLRDYSLATSGVAIGLYDRIELSYAQQAFDTKTVLTAIS